MSVAPPASAPNRPVCAALLLALAVTARAQVEWEMRVVLPDSRRNHAMAYDSLRQRLVLFGGHSAFPDATWEWDAAGDIWIRREPATSPPARAFHGMVFDSSRGRVVLFGGTDLGGTAYAETWVPNDEHLVWARRT